jgi:spoIIIJ-associated protein
LRARVRPAQVRPKQERRRKGAKTKAEPSANSTNGRADETTSTAGAGPDTATDDTSTQPTDSDTTSASTRRRPARSATTTSTPQRSTQNKEQQMSNEDRPQSSVTPEEVGAAAVAFMNGLTDAFGVDGSASLQVDELELRVDVTGSELGLLVGPGGRTLNAIQDLARVSAQRRLGDHETRLRIDVAGYRERREAALAAFARDIAEQVRTSGTARSLEPMSSSDRKVVHDVLNDETGVASRSVGEDPERRIIVEPA